MELTTTQKRQRLLTMIFGAIAIFFTGYPHVWSIYQPYVMEQAGWSQTAASMCFYLALSTFVFGNIIGGRLQDKYNPKIVVWIGGGIFAVGILASAFLIVPSPLPMYVTYGVMQGFGQGLILYRNYLDCSEMVSGKNRIRIRCGRNSKRIVWILSGTDQQKDLAGRRTGKDIPDHRRSDHGVMDIMWNLFTAPDKEWRRKAEQALREQSVANGNAEAQAEQKQYTSAEMMKTKNFYLLLATMLFGLISYFLVSPVSQTYQIELGIPSAIAVSAVMIGSIVNAGTRLVLPTLSDKIGRVGCIKGVLAVSVVAMAVLTFTRSYTVTAAIILMYGCYGGIMGSFPSFTSSIFWNRAYRRKLWIRNAWYRDRNMWSTGIVRIRYRKRIWHACGIRNGHCICSDRTDLSDDIGT